MTMVHSGKEPAARLIPASARDGYLPIGAYGLIGDMRCAALVATDGAIDWLCLPRFDSPAVFCRILDREIGSFLAIRPVTDGGPLRSSRAYRADSNVLETTLTGANGTVRITDAMPVEAIPVSPRDGLAVADDPCIIRLVEAVKGPVTIELEALLAFDFSLVAAEIEHVPNRGVIASDGTRCLALVWPGPLRQGKAGRLLGRLTLSGDESAICVVSHARSRTDALASLHARDWAKKIERTDAAWKSWAGGITVNGPYAPAIQRSALTLKMLTFQPTGAIVAAPTTSLPELIGGSRNWDYRYCWLRDTTFTLYAFRLVNDISAARGFWRWIIRTCAGTDPEKLQIIFGLHGECDLPERTLDHLSGYENSRPVRIGNEAANQVQLDTYGELLDAFHFYYLAVEKAVDLAEITPDTWQLMRSVADHICQIWRQPDQGIWEMRSAPRQYVYSKVMCWVGLDRALRLNELEPDRFAGDVERWRTNRDAIRAQVMERGYSTEIDSFTMSYGSHDLDAALLRLPLVGFLPANDERMRATIDRIEAWLSTDGLLKRYGSHVSDGLPPGEGAFAICSFWLVDCLVALGEIDRARDLYERLLGFCNDLGLFAEEIDPTTGAALGNFPQGFTHIGIIDAGIDLTAALLDRTRVSGAAADRVAVIERVKES